MKKTVLIFLASSFMAFSHSFAQDSVSTLTFDDAVKIALEKNVALNTQKNNLYLTEARRLQGYANYLPNIFAQGTAQRAEGLQINPVTGVGNNITADQVFASVNANYTLFNGFNRSNFLKQNNDQFMAQTFLVKRTNQDVIFNVTSQYLQVLLDQELFRIAQQNSQSQRVILEQIKGFVNVGTRAAADEYNQEAQVRNLEVTALRAKATLENDRALLLQTLQLDPSTEYKLVLPSWDTDIEFYNRLALDSLFSIALASRPDLQQQKYQVDAFKHSVRGNTSGYYPTVSLFTQYGSTYFSASDDTQPVSFKEQFVKNNPQFAYGLNLRIPIFDNLLTRSNRVTAKVNYENAVLTRDNLLKSVKIDVQRTYKNFGTATEAYRASQAQFAAGELALTTQQESYQLGVSSQVELANANQTYVLAAASRAQAEVTLLFQKILLEYALGTLKMDNLVEE